MAPEDTVTLTFGHQTMTLSYADYLAQKQDPFVEVEVLSEDRLIAQGYTFQIMRQSEFLALLDQHIGKIVADTGQLYLAGRGVAGLSSPILGIGAEVQAALSHVSGALGSSPAGTQERGELQQAASALEKAFGAIAEQVSGMGQGLITTADVLVRDEQKNAASFGRAVPDPRPGLRRTLAMEARDARGL